MDLPLNRILLGDCIEHLRQLPSESIDLVFADPPYNLQLRNDLHRPNQTKVDAVNDAWDKFASFADYDDFSEKWLQEVRRVLKKNGTLWVIGSYHNIFRIGALLQDLNYWILNDVVWIKTNPMPNFKGTRFNNAHETLIWAAKSDKSKFTFHYKSLKAANEDRQMRSDWYLPICSGKERIKTNGEKAHSTQKPEALLRRIIISSSNPGDVILDPFMGSGTTAAVAKMLGRNYIGIEQDKKYIAVAEQRLKPITSLPMEDLEYPTEVKPPRVAFGVLMESGYLSSGSNLYSPDLRFSAKILANGNIKSGEHSGSIHHVSAKLLNKEANNGWTFWCVKDDGGKLISIDELRSQFIKDQKEELN